LQDLRDNREFVHRVDADDRLCFVNAEWLAFAEENGWHISADKVLGTSIMAHMADVETRHLYRLLMSRARAGVHPVRFEYRCDSPALRRLMEMRIVGQELGQVEFRSRVLRVEPHDAIRMLDVSLPHSRDHCLQICGWCKAVQVQSAWLALEEAVQRLALLADAALPQLSHGICPDCSDRMTQVGGGP